MEKNERKYYSHAWMVYPGSIGVYMCVYMYQGPRKMGGVEGLSLYHPLKRVHGRTICTIIKPSLIPSCKENGKTINYPHSCARGKVCSFVESVCHCHHLFAQKLPDF